MAADNIILNSSDLNLSDDDIARQKLALWDEDDSASKHRRRIGSLVAVGDSWFSYPLGIDILDHLTRRGYEIRRFAKPGDTLENMVFGTSFNRHTFERRPAPLDEALRVLEAQQGVDAFLFSGGGNDMAGESLESFLEHSETPLPTVRADFVGHVIFRVFRSVYQAMIGRVRQKAPMIPILVHGYGWVIPDGRGYRRLGLEWAGPWLRPAFTKKGITDASERRAIVRSVIDQFNQMLAGIAEDHEGVHYIDLRSDIEDGDWENELHTTSASYGRIAERFHEVIVQARSAGIPDSGATAALGALLPAVTIDATLTSSASSPGGLAETLKPSLDGLRHVETGVDRFLERFRSQLQAEQLPATNVEFRTVGLETWSGAHRHSAAPVLVLSAVDAVDGIPLVAHQLAVAANLAHEYAVRLRPIGHHESRSKRRQPLHNWSPIHVDPGAQDVLYVSFDEITGIIDVDVDVGLARVYCGTQIRHLAEHLHGLGLTLPAIPAPGVLSVGGAIAIGAHGTRLNDAEPDAFRWPGTISGTVVAATVIAWDGTRYVAKRLTDGMEDLAFVSVSLGRVLVVDVTLRVREDYGLVTQFSRERANVLLGPESTPNSLSGRLLHDNVEVLAFRSDSASNPWIHSISWRSTTRAPGVWKAASFLNKLVTVRQSLASLVGAAEWPLVARMAHENADALIGQHEVGHIDVGPAAAQRMYVTSETLKVEPLGWALVLRRDQLQTAAHELYGESMRLLAKMQPHSKVHQHLAFELRFAESDGMGANAAPTLSVAAPVGFDAHSGAGSRQVVMWVNILAAQTPRTIQGRVPYLRAFEQYLLARAAHHGWIARPEWSKGWAYADGGAWRWPTSQLRALLSGAWPGASDDSRSWAFACATAWKLDPHGVFTTPFHDKLLPRSSDGE